MISLCHYKTKLILLMMNFFCRWAGSRKRKVQSHFWRTGPDFCWNVWLLKNHPASNSHPIPLFLIPIYYFPYTQKFTSRLFSRHNCFNPSPQNCTFNIPYFVVLLFSYYLIKKKEYPIRSIISWLLFMWNQNLLICYSHGSYFFAMICSNSRNEKKFLFWSIPNVQKSHIYKTRNTRTRKSPQILPEKRIPPWQ